jgi:CIC family chloride channel protein
VVLSKRVEHFFKHLPWSALRKAMLGGVLVSILCVAMPPLFGEGYTVVKSLAGGHGETILQNSFFGYFPPQSWMLLVFTGCVCLLKAFATSITIQSGGNGGNFAPSLFAGGFLGFFFAMLCSQIGFTDVPVTNLVIVGMAGVMAGVMYAPLTAIFLIAESSSGYDLFIPLMIVSTTSYLMAKWFSPISPELTELAKEGKVFTKAHDNNILLMLKMQDLVEEDIQRIDIGSSLRELIELVKDGHRNIIAVVSQQDKLEGIITLDDIRPIMFSPELYDSVTVKKLMKAPPAVVSLKDNITLVLKKFDEAQVWSLPVVQDKKLMGFVSKSRILNKYRLLLQEYSES